MLIGDMIVAMRELGPDPCQTLAPPVLNSLAVTNIAGGVFNPGTTYYCVLTALTPFGESLPSNEIALAMTGGNNAITFTYAFSALTAVSGTGLSAIRFYVGGQSGVYNTYIQLSPTPLTQTVAATNANGNVPTQNRAYLPDSDGGFVSAQTAYRWLNEALSTLARATNGIQDVCGIASVSGQRRYVAPGQWLRFDQCFYDGWELDLGNKAETFRNRNLTANISISLMVDAQSDTTRIELYWTPSRTSGTAITAGNISKSANLIFISPPSGWLLQDGLAQLSDGGSNQEIITYSAQTSSQMSGCIRGWAGTQPYPFNLGASVTELNIELNGYRMPYVYSLGQSTVNLGVPPGWEPFVKSYMLGLFRDAEQERQEASDLMKQATAGVEQWAKSNRPVAGPRQCRMYGDYGIRGLVPGGLSGGLIIP